jgi:hypothetical protein
MAKTLGYMVTFTTYGTWLQGNGRRYVKNAIILPKNKRLEQANKQLHIEDTIRLSKIQQKTVCAAILKEGILRGQRIIALTVKSTHVHFVAEYIPIPINRVVAWYKSAARLALKNLGHKGKLWTKGYDKRYCFDKETLQREIQYVQNHNPT